MDCLTAPLGEDISWGIIIYFLFIYLFILHVPLPVVILHAFFHIYTYDTMFINAYSYCYILRYFGFFSVASNFVERKCVYVQ